MRLVGGRFFARWFGRNSKPLGSKTKPAVALASSPQSKNDIAVRPVMDMSKLACLPVMDMWKLARMDWACATDCSKTCFAQVEIILDPTPLDVLEPDDAMPLGDGDVVALVEPVVETTPVETVRVDRPDRGLAARLQVVAAMNGPKALRAPHVNLRSTTARPAPIKRIAANRTTRHGVQTTWPTYTGRTAALLRTNIAITGVDEQVAALRAKVMSGFDDAAVLSERDSGKAKAA